MCQEEKVFAKYKDKDHPAVKRANQISDKNSSGDEIANVNFFYNITHVEASAYAHWTSS